MSRSSSRSSASAEFSDDISRARIHCRRGRMLVVSVAVRLLFLGEIGRSNGKVCSAFLQNLLMSGLFIAMFLSRHGGRRQSLVIAVAKWFGKLAPMIQFGLISGRRFVLGIGLLCSVLDLAYIGLLVHDRRRSGIAPGRPVASASADA
jgi:hypothetical protein